jgi:stringent starvation protein B
MEPQTTTSTRPYLIRALYEWCTDNALTPYVAVLVDDSVQVPREYVKNGEIVLNISFDATSGLKLGNEFIEFKARFAGSSRDIVVPIGRVIAVYARENGQGMAFPMPTAVSSIGEVGAELSKGEVLPERPAGLTPVSSAGLTTAGQPSSDRPPTRPGGGRPSLKRVK